MGQFECCQLFPNFVLIITAYLFPKNRFNITRFPLLNRPEETIPLKIKILYGIEKSSY